MRERAKAIGKETINDLSRKSTSLKLHNHRNHLSECSSCAYPDPARRTSLLWSHKDTPPSDDTSTGVRLPRRLKRCSMTRVGAAIRIRIWICGVSDSDGRKRRTRTRRKKKRRRVVRKEQGRERLRRGWYGSGSDGACWN